MYLRVSADLKAQVLEDRNKAGEIATWGPQRSTAHDCSLTLINAPTRNWPWRSSHLRSRLPLRPLLALMPPALRVRPGPW